MTTNSYLLNLRRMAPRLWLPIDEPGNPLGQVPGGLDGIFEVEVDASGAPAGIGTWVAVSGLPEPQSYTSVEPLSTSRGIQAISTDLQVLPDGSLAFGVSLLPSDPRPHVLAVRLRGDGVPPMRFRREFPVFAMDVAALPPVPEAGACGDEFPATLTGVPAVVLRELALRSPAEVFRTGPEHNVTLTRFEATRPAGGTLWFQVAGASDLQTLDLSVVHPTDGRRIGHPPITRFHQHVPRLELRGPWSGASFPATPPARFRIGPIAGMEVGEADLVQAVYADLSQAIEPVDGTYFFQVRAARADAPAEAPGFDPASATFETRTSEGLGVILAVDERHTRLLFAEVTEGRVGDFAPLQGTNTIAFAQDAPNDVEIVRPGVSQTIPLPNRALVLAFDQVELTSDEGLLRDLDSGTTSEGSDIRITVFLANSCGVVTPIDLGLPG